MLKSFWSVCHDCILRTQTQERKNLHLSFFFKSIMIKWTSFLSASKMSVRREMVPWTSVLTSPMSIVSGDQSGNSKFSPGQFVLGPIDHWSLGLEDADQYWSEKEPPLFLSLLISSKNRHISIGCFLKVWIPPHYRWQGTELYVRKAYGSPIS